MRRIIGGLLAFLAFTGTLLVLPVYAAPAPPAHPVETSIDEVELGSVTDPAPQVEVVVDGDVVEGGVGTDAGPVADAGPAVDGVPQPTPTGAAGQSSEPDAPTVSSGEELPGVPALTVSRPDTDAFSAVGVTWQSSSAVTDVVVQLRVRDTAGAWSGWTELEPDDADGIAAGGGEKVRDGTAPYWVGPSTGVEALVQSASGQVPQDVRLALVDPGTSAADALPAAAPRARAHAGSAMPDVVTRAQWGADESIRTWDPQYAPTIRAATIHHTADRNDYTAAQVPAMMRAIYAFHTETRGWGDIGYNVIVDKFGRVFEGRYGGLASTVVGAHAGGFNSGTFGVSMLGNYADTDVPAATLEAVASIIAWKFSLYGVDPRGSTQLTSAGGGTSRYAAGAVVTLPTIFAHRDVGSTTCPGQYAYDRMGQIRDLVTARMGTAPGGSPVGNLERLTVTGNTALVTGWIFDPDYPPGSIDVGVVVDGSVVTRVNASGTRPDVAAAVPGAGPAHGFDTTVALTPGQHTVCVVAYNFGTAGRDTWLQCKVLTAVAVPSGPAGRNPVGAVDQAAVSGRTVSVRGWALDPDALTAASVVHVYVDGAWGGQVVADAVRPEVAAGYPGAGDQHGFTWSADFAAPGSHQVCFYAINVGQGTTNPQLGCRTATVSPEAFRPVGNLESVAVVGRRATITGWALDGDAPTSPVAVHVYVDGRWATAQAADATRFDVAAAYAGAGSSHGYAVGLDLPAGRHDVCTYAINMGAGDTNPSLGCRTVVVDPVAWNPFGTFDDVVAHGSTLVAWGWVADPDVATAPVDVHFYVDGRWAGVLTADQDRFDVGAAFPELGPRHGWTAYLPVGPGRHTLCAYAINRGQGSTNPLLDCRSVTA